MNYHLSWSTIEDNHITNGVAYLQYLPIEQIEQEKQYYLRFLLKFTHFAHEYILFLINKKKKKIRYKLNMIKLKNK